MSSEPECSGCAFILAVIGGGIALMFALAVCSRLVGR